MHRDWIKQIEAIDFHYLEALKTCTHKYEDNPNPYHLEHDGNVWGHTLDVYEKSRELYPEDEILQLACLLHDISKPDCREENHETKRTSFHNHENFGVARAAYILNNLHIDYSDKIRVIHLIQRHGDTWKLDIKKLKQYYTRTDMEDLIKIRWCDTLGRIKADDDGKDVEQIKELEAMIGDGVFDIFKPTNDSEALPTCTILIGLPLSGKSTYIKENNIENVLSRDDIIMQMGDSDNYSECWSSVDQKLVDQNFRLYRSQLIGCGCDFTVDMTNMNIKSRNKQIHDIKKTHNLKAVVFLTCYDELLKRNKERKNKTLAPFIITGMVKRWQLPVAGEGFSDVKYIIT